MVVAPPRGSRFPHGAHMNSTHGSEETEQWRRKNKEVVSNWEVGTREGAEKMGESWESIPKGPKENKG